jgi:hypothetical protein
LTPFPSDLSFFSRRTTKYGILFSLLSHLAPLGWGGGGD